uniref:AIG1-type G domain-containing protein n=1 Tax=Astyanax mexicanus TaxID=7994 RepID=A0A8B9HLZ2_ASTMX
MEELRIVLLGKTVGKSSVGNTILGENVFKEECSLKNATQICKRAEKVINGRRIVVIDTPGIFDTDRSEEELRDEIISSLVECAPGPHVFILVLKIERHTKENQQTLEKLLEYFTDSIFPHMILLFTHGEDLDKDIKVSDLIKQCDEGKYSLKDLAEKCGNRVHVIDNKHWNTETDKTPWFKKLSDQDGNLMKSIKNILRENNGRPYNNKTLEEIGKAINKEVDNIVQELDVKNERVDMVEVRRRARERVRTELQRKLTGVTVGILLGALLGVGVGAVAPFVLVAGLIRAATHQRPQAGDPPVQAHSTGIKAAVGAGVLLLYRAVKGESSGYEVSKTADNPKQAAEKASKAVVQNARDVLKTCWNLGNTETGPEYESLNKSK